MKLTHTLLLAVAAASLALSSCSSEPSDWRPDDKVSLDMVAPGTRSSDNFDQHTDYAPNQAKGGAITKPVSSAVELDARPAPAAKSTISANAEEGMRKRGQMNDAGKSGQEADAAEKGEPTKR